MKLKHDFIDKISIHFCKRELYVHVLKNYGESYVHVYGELHIHVYEWFVSM